MVVLTTIFSCQTTHPWSRVVKFAHTNTPQRPLNPKIFHQPPIRDPTNTWSITTSNHLIRKQQPLHPVKPYDPFYKKNMNNMLCEEDYEAKTAKLVESVRREFAKFNDESFDDLIMVDALQRLAIDRHFKDEINSILTRRYLQLTNNKIDILESKNLFEVSLYFRILRQNGFYVSADIFTRFKGNDNRFDERWKDELTGLLALYEASHLGTYEETILDEAQDFSHHLLLDSMEFLDAEQAETIRHTLENPYHKTLPSFNLTNCIKYFKGTVLQELAELDFSNQRRIHQMELDQFSRWWKDVGLVQEVSLARDQPLKWYLWAMVALTNPNLSEQRIDLTKTISLIYIIDDIFDVYGTIDDLTMFTQAINRWDIQAIEQLPAYMKSSFKALYDVTNDIARKVCEQHGFNPISSLWKSWATLCNAFLLEAKWFASGQVPKAKEYLENAMVTSGVHVVLVLVFFLLGNATNEEQTNLINDNHHIISSVAKILRLWDDLGTAQDENQEGRDGSYMLCYLNEHEGCSIEIAREHVINMISDNWKHLNKDSLRPSPFSDDFIKAANNATRMVPLMYNYGENSSLPQLDDYIKVMLYDGF